MMSIDLASLGPRWARERYAQPPERLARELLGVVLVRVLTTASGPVVLAGRIVETEAYIGAKDRASHAFGGRHTSRNHAMYMGPGIAYVYFTYGLHHCMNVVCSPVGQAQAVLIRALEPVLGREHMRFLRSAPVGASARVPKPTSDERLCAGPARLCQALAIDRALDQTDLCTSDTLWLADPPASLPRPKPRTVVRAPRIGVDYAGAWADRPLRFLVASSASISVPPPASTGLASRTPGRGKVKPG